MPNISISTELKEEIQNNKLANTSDIHEIVKYSSYFLPTNDEDISEYISFDNLCGDNAQTIGNYSVNGNLPFHVKEYAGELRSYYRPYVTGEFDESGTSPMANYFYEPIISFNIKTNRVVVELKSKGNVPGEYSSFWATINMCETSTVSCALAENVLYTYSFTGSVTKDIIITTNYAGGANTYPSFKITIDTNQLLRSNRAYKFILLTTKKIIEPFGDFDVIFEFNVYEEQNISLDYSNYNKIPRLRDVYFSTEKEIRVDTGFSTANYPYNVNLGKMELWRREGTASLEVMDDLSCGFFAGTFNTTMGPLSVNYIVNEYYAGSVSTFQIGNCLKYGNSGRGYNYVLKFPNLKITNLSNPSNTPKITCYYNILYSDGTSTGFTAETLSPFDSEESTSISSQDLINGKGIYLGDIFEIMNIDGIKIVLRPTGTGDFTGISGPSKISFPFRRFYNYLDEPLNRNNVPIL
jgi:hypothetical protein